MPCTQNTCGVAAENQGCSCAAEVVHTTGKKKKKDRRRSPKIEVLNGSPCSGEVGAAELDPTKPYPPSEDCCNLNESCGKSCESRCDRRYHYSKNRSNIGFKSYGPVEQYPHVHRAYWGFTGPHN